MSDPLEDLSVAREEADVLTQQLERTHQLMERVEGADESGEVRVLLDRDGSFESVRIGFAWRQKFGPERLSPLIVEAIGAAKTARLEAWAHAFGEVDDEPAPRARPSADGDPIVTAMRELTENPQNAPEATFQAANTVLTDLIDGLDEANRLLDAHADSTFKGRSSSGHVTVTVSGGGELQSVDFDRRWIERAHDANVSREATEAILRAGKEAREQGLSAILQTTKIAQIARLATDPAAARTYFSS
jgi:DNA-binding protein YbaB